MNMGVEGTGDDGVGGAFASEESKGGVGDRESVLKALSEGVVTVKTSSSLSMLSVLKSLSNPAYR